MVKPMLLLAGLAALASPILATPVTAQAQTRGQRSNGPEATSARAGRETMLRAGPDGDYPDVRRLPQGQSVAIMGCLPDGRWCDVDLNGARGWVQAADLDGDDRGRRTSIAELAGAGRVRSSAFNIGEYWDSHYRQQAFYGQRQRWEQQYFDRYQANWGPRPDGTRWNSSSVNGTMVRRSWLLAGPGWRFPHITLVPARARVAIHACLPSRNWCDISYRGARGWVAGTLVTVMLAGRRQTVALVGRQAGVASSNFVIGIYWNDHYRNQPFYRERNRWQRGDGRGRSMIDDRPQSQQQER